MPEEMVEILDKTFRKFITQDKVETRIAELATQLNEEYRDKPLYVLGVLTGGYMLVSELTKRLTIPCRIGFIKVSSYEGTKSTGTIKKHFDLSDDVSDSHVVVVDDIIDTGRTMEWINNYLRERKALDVKVATILVKPDALERDIDVKYCCFEIENKFVVGFGLDYNGYGRNLPDIYQLVK